MTTLNTIIEEEKKEFGNLYVEVEEVMERSVLDKYEAFLTTAMQRAYEAGINSVAKSIEEIAEGEFANAIYSWTPHDYVLHIEQLKNSIDLKQNL